MALVLLIVDDFFWTGFMVLWAAVRVLRCTMAIWTSLRC